MPPFNDPDEEEFRKHCGKKWKMLVTKIFSFYHNFFNLFKENPYHLNHIQFVVRYAHSLFLSHTILTFNHLKERSFENIVRIGENAGKQHFHLFPQCFLPFPKTSFIFISHIYFSICKCFRFGSV